MNADGTVTQLDTVGEISGNRQATFVQFVVDFDKSTTRLQVHAYKDVRLKFSDGREFAAKPLEELFFNRKDGPVTLTKEKVFSRDDFVAFGKQSEVVGQ